MCCCDESFWREHSTASSHNSWTDNLTWAESTVDPRVLPGSENVFLMNVSVIQ